MKHGLLLEHDFARWVGAEAALYFTSGYAANIGLLSALLRPEDVVFSDSANHASLIDGIRLAKCRRVIFPHLDLNFLEDELRRNASVAGARVIVVESIFSMEGDRAPLADLAALAERYGAELIVDEAHAIGVRGPARQRLRGGGRALRARSRDRAYLRQSARGGRRICLRLGESAPFSDQSRAHFYFQHGPAAVFRFAGFRRNESRRGSGSRTRSPDGVERFPEERIAKRMALILRRSDSQIVPVILGPNDAAVNFAEYLTSEGIRRSRDSSAHGSGGIRAASFVPDGKTFQRNSCRTCRRDDSSPQRIFRPRARFPFPDDRIFRDRHGHERGKDRSLRAPRRRIGRRLLEARADGRERRHGPRIGARLGGSHGRPAPFGAISI